MTVHSLIAELVGIHKNYLKNYYNIHESKFSSINNLPIKCKFVNFYQTNLQVIATAVFKDNTGVPPIILKRIFKIQVDENYSLPIQKFLHYATEFMGPGIYAFFPECKISYLSGCISLKSTRYRRTSSL